MEVSSWRLNALTFFHDSDPDDTVHTSLSTYATEGDYFFNISSQDMFVCIQGGTSEQIWEQIAYTEEVEEMIAAALPEAPSQSSASRSLNSAFQISTTRNCLVVYSVNISSSLSISGGESGTVVLEIASDFGFTTNVQELSRCTNGNTGTLTIGLSLVQDITASMSGFVPSGYYCRLRTANNTGTPTFTYRSGQEVLL